MFPYETGSRRQHPSPPELQEKLLSLPELRDDHADKSASIHSHAPTGKWSRTCFLHIQPLPI